MKTQETIFEEKKRNLPPHKTKLLREKRDMMWEFGTMLTYAKGSSEWEKRMLRMAKRLGRQPIMDITVLAILPEKALFKTRFGIFYFPELIGKEWGTWRATIRPLSIREKYNDQWTKEMRHLCIKVRANKVWGLKPSKSGVTFTKTGGLEIPLSRKGIERSKQVYDKTKKLVLEYIPTGDSDIWEIRYLSYKGFIGIADDWPKNLEFGYLYKETVIGGSIAELENLYDKWLVKQVKNKL